MVQPHYDRSENRGSETLCGLLYDKEQGEQPIQKPKLQSSKTSIAPTVTQDRHNKWRSSWSSLRFWSQALGTLSGTEEALKIFVEWMNGLDSHSTIHILTTFQGLS